MEYHKTEWPLKICNVKEAWGLDLPAHGLGKNKGEGIIIVHPDTGYTHHPELLKGKRYLINSSRNYFRNKKLLVGNETLAEDFLMTGFPERLFNPSHGTSTASLMISDEGHPNNPDILFPEYVIPKDQFVTGIAPKVKVIPIQVSNSVLLRNEVKNYLDEKVNTWGSLARAILFATDYKSREVGVISISLGGVGGYEYYPGGSEYLTGSLIQARRRGIIVCAAAGQTMGVSPNIKPVAFPGKSPHTICVAGCDINFRKPDEGHYGPEVDITAPGWDVTVARTLSIPPANDQKHLIDNKELLGKSVNGTSYSTALTAGACALWQAYHNRGWLIKEYGRPFLLDLFRHCLQESCFRPDGWETAERGRGILDVKALLNYDLPDVNDVKDIAINNNWTEDYWGDPNNWYKAD